MVMLFKNVYRIFSFTLHNYFNNKKNMKFLSKGLPAAPEVLQLADAVIFVLTNNCHSICK